MPFLIGTDEAGYGPNLGPLVVSASVWQVDSLDDDLYEKFRPLIHKPSNRKVDSDKIEIGDSKDLYKPGKGLGGLEQGIFSCLAALGRPPQTWRSIWHELAQEDLDSILQLPWYQDFDDELPLDSSFSEIQNKADRFVEKCRSVGCNLRQIKSRVVCPPAFNAQCEVHGNKATTLSHTTLELVRTLMDALPEDQPVFVLCDKHGGRKKYVALLQSVFPCTLPRICSEKKLESTYELGSEARIQRFVFRAKADQDFMPSALASMVSKYLRELAMKAFNAFWLSKVTDLKPTAGYPVDAKRFKQDIEECQKSLGIEDHRLWRYR